LFYSELLKSQVYQAKGQLDSAKVYAKKAFFGLPNNALHASHYINLINQTKIEKLLRRLLNFDFKNDPNNWKNYLSHWFWTLSSKRSLFIERAKKASELFPGDQDIQGLYRQIAIGVQGLNQASQFSADGLDYFNKGDHVNAALEFEKAIEANPLDYAHYENAATSNYLNGNLEKALEQIDVGD
jgi:tetratricopeptide (TPR) repeat protein